MLLLTFIICYLCVAAHSSEDDFTCIAGNFTTGQSGNVTCHFGSNIHNTGYHFEIVRYPFDAPSSHSGEDVLRCHRLGNELKCTTGKGFVFNKNIQNNLTVSIPKVTADQAGRYACQLIPPDDRKKRLCDLNVEEVEVVSSILRHDPCSEKVLVLSVLVGLLLLLCCFITIYFNCRKRKKKLLQALSCFKRVHRQTTDEEETVDLLLGGHSSERQEPFKMPTIKPYTDSDLEDEPEEEKQKTKFAGDDEDASGKLYKINIYPYNPADDTDRAGESEEHQKYSGDEFDKGRKPYKLTIKAYDEDETDQIGSPPPRGQFRYPHHPYRPV